MSKIRTIQGGMYQVTAVDVTETGHNLPAWLTAQAKAYRLTTLLAHADDGVIWGRMEQDHWLTAREVFAQMDFPALQWITLQQARLFGPGAELLLWRTDAGWQARLVQDGIGQEVEFYDEWQMLWGTRMLEQAHGFTLVTDGTQGHHHAPPIQLAKEAFGGPNRRPLRLQTRHYLTVADDGLLKVALSRLVGLTTESQMKEE